MSDQDEPTMFPSLTPRGSIGSGLLSFSSGASISPATSLSSSSGSSKSAVSECLSAWLNYFQILNGLCSSGYRLAQTISALEQWGEPQNGAGLKVPPVGGGPSQIPNAQFITAWDDLARATAVATSTVKSHVVNVLQEFVTQSVPTNPQMPDAAPEPIDVQRIRDHNQQVIMETTQTMINIQHQFCVASYESFSALMCCFVCQAPVGYPHDAECAIMQQQQAPTQFVRQQQADPTTSSQTSSPKFGSISGLPHVRNQADQRAGMMFGSATSSGQASSSEHSGGGGGLGMDVRGPSPVQGFLDHVRGPLPNPGNLLGMKATPASTYHRGGSRSPLNCPLFPLVGGQRRWSEAAAGEVRVDPHYGDPDSNMRRWSMPWEASARSVVVQPHQNTVAWHQARVIPGARFSVAAASCSGKSASDRSQSATPDSIWHSSTTSQDGLAEAIQLLSFRPARINQHPPHPPFIEESSASYLPDNTPAYEMWSDSQQRLPCIKFNSERDDTN